MKNIYASPPLNIYLPPGSYPSLGLECLAISYEIRRFNDIQAAWATSA
jgi:hypothetical protein